MRRQLLVSAAALVLSTSLPALAQTAPSTGAPPARIANTYNWRHHQPTQQDVKAAEGASGASPSSQSFDQVEDEVQALLKQSDEAIRRYNEDLEAQLRMGLRASR